MRLSADILSRADQFLNPLKERELHLRGFKIPGIENLAVVQDQFDIIDLSDNEIKRLDNFPKMTRLSSILMNNNYVARIGKVAENVPNMKCLVLTNNRITCLGEIDNIALFKKLEHLSLLDNPVGIKQNYRLYIIHKIPSLKTLDYKKISKKEKDESTKFFRSSVGVNFMASIEDEKSKQGDSINGTGKQAQPLMDLSDEQKLQVRAAIDSATTREEIDLIQKHLKMGSLAFLIPKESVPDPTVDQVGLEEDKKEEKS